MTDDEKKRSDENLRRLNAAWDNLTWWQQKKIFLTAMWFANIYWISQIPIRWVKYQLRKGEGGK